MKQKLDLREKVKSGTSVKNGNDYPERLTIAAVKDTDGIVTNYVVTQIDPAGEPNPI